MGPEIKQKWDEHIYQMEKCSFLLDAIRAHVSVIMTTDAHSGSMLDACVIMGGVSPQYCDFILKMREKFPDYDLEMLSQEIYDRIFSRDYKSTARFQQFFEKPLEEWYIVRKRARDLRNGLLDRDEVIANFKHAYYMQFETDVDVIEIEKPEHKQQETEPEIETMSGETPEQAQARVDMGTAMREWVADERREERLETLFELVQDGTMNAGNAFEYVPSDYGLDFDTFLRMQEAWEEEKQHDDSDD